MAAFDYVASRADSTELLAEFGQEVILHKRGAATGPAYDPLAGATVDTPMVAVDLELAAKDRTGALVGTTTRTLYIPGGDVEPAKGDAFTVAGERCEVIEVRTLAPAGYVVMWEVDIAR